MSFGVTPSDVAAYGNGLFFRDAAVGPPAVTATQPSAAQCTAYIGEAAQRVNAWLTGMGIAPDSITSAQTPDTYAVCRRLVLLDTAAWALAARDRSNVDLAAEYRRQYDAELKRLAAGKASLGTGRNVSANGPGLPHGTGDPTKPLLPPNRGADFWSRSNGQL